MKSIFKTTSGRTRTPADIVRQTHDLLNYVNQQQQRNPHDPTLDRDKMSELSKHIQEMKTILYGEGEADPITESCTQLAQAFYKDDTFRLLIVCLPQLELEDCNDATQIIANLQVHARLIASSYLEANKDLLDILISGYENLDISLHYGAILRECIRHQTAAKYLLAPEHVRKFFMYVEDPNYELSSDAFATFKDLLTRHKSAVADFLSKNYNWFFEEYNMKLVKSNNYITRRQALKLLGIILTERANAVATLQYVSSKDNLKVLMDTLRESSKNIQLESFPVFKVFVDNEKKPVDIINILRSNKEKLLRFIANLQPDKEDEKFNQDKAEVLKKIANLELPEHT